MEEASDQSFLSRFKSLFRKAKPRDEEAELTEEIYDLMDEGQAKGLISGEVSEMVHAVLDLKETKAYEIMVPRTQVISAPLTISLSDAIKLISVRPHQNSDLQRQHRRDLGDSPCQRPAQDVLQ